MSQLSAEVAAATAQVELQLNNMKRLNATNYRSIPNKTSEPTHIQSLATELVGILDRLKEAGNKEPGDLDLIKATLTKGLVLTEPGTAKLIHA